MKTSIILAFCVGIVFCSCKKTSENILTEPSNNETIAKSLSEKDISKIKYKEYVLGTDTEKAIEDWIKFRDIQDIVQQVNKGDLSFFKDNKKGIKTLLDEFKKSIPDTINTPSVMARITAFETKLYKLESLSNLETTSKQELAGSIKEFLQAYSNLNFQMNKKLEKDSQHIERP